MSDIIPLEPEPDHTVGGAAHGYCRGARDVLPGQSWAFFEHRSMAEVIAATRRLEPSDLEIVAEIGGQ